MHRRYASAGIMTRYSVTEVNTTGTIIPQAATNFINPLLSENPLNHITNTKILIDI